MEKPVNLHEEAFVIHWIRQAAEALTDNTHFICNDLKLTKRLSHERQTFLMLELIAREPRPFVEYLESGKTGQIPRISAEVETVQIRSALRNPAQEIEIRKFHAAQIYSFQL